MKNNLVKGMTRGFSLIELMVVVTLMALLVGLGTVFVMGRLEEGKKKAAQTQVYEIAKALDLYNLQTGSYPSNSEGLDVLINPKKGQPIMKDAPIDPWNREYNYKIPGEYNPKGFDVWSDGPDGQGGESAIGNWRSE